MWHFSNVYLSSFWDLYLFIIAGSWFSIQCSLQHALQPFWPQCKTSQVPKTTCSWKWDGEPDQSITCNVMLEWNARKGTEVVSKTCLEIFVRDFHIQDLFWSLGLSCVKFHCSAKTFSHAQPSADIWPPSCPGWVESQSLPKCGSSPSETLCVAPEEFLWGKDWQPSEQREAGSGSGKWTRTRRPHISW